MVAVECYISLTSCRVFCFCICFFLSNQCDNPSNRNKCPTNPSTDIAGLMSVLPRLLALPSTLKFVTAAQRALWSTHLADLPALPLEAANTKVKTKYNTMKLAPVAHGNWTVVGTSNSENTALYSAHPFRIYGVGKPDLTLAQQTYEERPFPCNDGWCQDIIQAAMLNLTDDATAQLIQRASAGAAKGFRFPGFAAHYQDYEPSLDHYGFMRTGLDYMLMAPLDDAKKTIQLFPAFPTSQFNVRFKLHAPLNTTIEASCQNGTLEYLTVTPAARRRDVIVLNCAE